MVAVLVLALLGMVARVRGQRGLVKPPGIE